MAIPVVMFLAVATSSQWGRFIDAGATDYRVKPRDRKNLRMLVDSRFNATTGPFAYESEA